MSQLQSHPGRADETRYNEFLVILKVYADAIHILATEDSLTKRSEGKPSLKVLCRDTVRGVHVPESGVSYIVLSNPPKIDEQCRLSRQKPSGQELGKGDFIMFITAPIKSVDSVTYAIDIHLTDHESNSEAVLSESQEIKYTALVNIDPKYSTSGLQRVPIVINHHPIGNLQVEYLVATNPEGYGRPGPRPDWLFKQRKLDSGHRGCGLGLRLDLPEKLLENTIASFNHAYRHGANICELDVMVSSDGIPVVFHDFEVIAITEQQQDEELGKTKNQVDELTLDKMKSIRTLFIRDDKSTPMTLHIKDLAPDNRPFPTLAEVLDKVDPGCGLNIEIKWPQLFETGKMEARKNREINATVDRIIEVVSKHSKGRNVILESFDADLVMLLRLKQNTVPVIFLSQGMTVKYDRYIDIRARYVENSTYFAQAMDLAGLDLNFDDYCHSGKELIKFINSRCLVARAWVDVYTDMQKLKAVKSLDLQCMTYDKIDILRGKLLGEV